jgi:hypothetical protein
MGKSNAFSSSKTNVNVVRNGQDMNMIQKDFKANCKEDYGQIKLHLFASTSKRITNVAWKNVFKGIIWTITIGVFWIIHKLKM